MERQIWVLLFAIKFKIAWSSQVKVTEDVIYLFELQRRTWWKWKKGTHKSPIILPIILHYFSRVIIIIIISNNA